jgi:hypothetical protein
MLVSYPEPVDSARPAPASHPVNRSATVWDLASGRAGSIQPGHTDRQARRDAVADPITAQMVF